MACPGPHLNALKHGLRSGHVLLPGDDIFEFRKLRHRLFHLHRPRTIAEAKHVETLAANQWRAARCKLEQRFFKQHLGAAMSGHPDATGSLGNPDLHWLHHRATDCSKEERRLELSSAEAETALRVMQHQRTQHLTPGNVAVLEDYTVFLAEGEPVVEEEGDTTAPGSGAVDAGDVPSGDSKEDIVGRASLPGQTAHASVSADRGNSIPRKRAGSAPARVFPKHWSRRQREAALRREGVG